MVLSMTVLLEKTLISARRMGKELLPFTNIPFLYRNVPDAYSTCFQEDFQHFNLKKVEPCHHPVPAQGHAKDLGYTEYFTETAVSYQHHSLPQIPLIPRAMHKTNFKMETDSRMAEFLTTHAQNFQAHSLQLPQRPIRPTFATMWIQHVEKLLESTIRVSFIPHSGSPFVKATGKHLA